MSYGNCSHKTSKKFTLQSTRLSLFALWSVHIVFVFRHYMRKCGNSGGFTDFVALNFSSRLIDNHLSRESVSVRKCCLLVSIITFKGLILERAYLYF